jgi:antitoxin CptB
MTEGNPDHATDTLRRRLLFQSKHRGVKELDLILGPFAEANLAGFDLAELREYAVLLAEPDPDIYDWLVGRLPLPPRLQNRVTQRVFAFGNAHKTTGRYS